MPVALARGRGYVYVVVDHYTHVIYTRRLCLKSEAVKAFKAFRAAAENESGKKIRGVMMDNVRKLSMGKMCDISKCGSSIRKDLRLSTFHYKFQEYILVWGPITHNKQGAPLSRSRDEHALPKCVPTALLYAHG